jgi:alginate O-acetyltransferase complex protein AlgI
LWIPHVREVSRSRGRLMLAFGVFANLAVLAYFKYLNFFLDITNVCFGWDMCIGKVFVPLAISFHTFQQISYLVEVYRGTDYEANYLDYSLFVTFFPQLIAGPIVRHHELAPQFRKPSTYVPHYENLSVGLTLFFFGLAKKVLCADSVAHYADAVFSAASNGQPVTFFEAWLGVSAFTLQIYFDFAGYSDMAIGLARMFGVRLPLNFNSPYKARNIIDFWRRWHVSLSRFFRDYLYFPLGGNKNGLLSQSVNVLIVMALCGLWHGAGWSFVIWGLLHGIFIVIAHSWGRVRGSEPMLPTWVGTALTMVSVMVAWVFFRAENVWIALDILRSMVGLNGISLPSILQSHGSVATWVSPGPVQFSGFFPLLNETIYREILATAWICSLGFLCLFCPNTLELLGRFHPALGYRAYQVVCLGRSVPQWQPRLVFLVITLLIACFSLSEMGHEREFIYFQF